MKDEWSGLAIMWADLILKYADKVLADDPPLDSKENKNDNSIDHNNTHN